MTCGKKGGHWDRFDTITGIFADGDGNVTQINTIWGNYSYPYDQQMTLEGFDQSLRSYSVLPPSDVTLLGFNFTWTKNYLGTLSSWDNTVQAQKMALNNNYYGCVFNGGEPKGSAREAVADKLKEEAKFEAAEASSTSAARVWYGLTDARFKAWGRYSKVLVPQLSGKIAGVLEAGNAAGWVYTDAKLAGGLAVCNAFAPNQ